MSLAPFPQRGKGLGIGGKTNFDTVLPLKKGRFRISGFNIYIKKTFTPLPPLKRGGTPAETD